MDGERLLTAIDVGTTKVCTIIAKVQGDKKVDVLGTGIVPSQGLRKGNVVDIESTQYAVRASIEDASAQAGVKVSSAYVGVTGSHVVSGNQWGSVEATKNSTVITPTDIDRVKDSLYESEGSQDREVIHVLPRYYSLDGMIGIRNPIGMHAQNLQVQSHTITGASSIIKNLVQAVENVDVKVLGMVLEPLASGEAVLTQEEREMGVVLVDIGGGTSDMAVFHDGTILHTAVIPVGGYQFTNDISMSFDTPYFAAEEAKLKYGHVNVESIDINEEIEIPLFGKDGTISIPRRDLCLLLKERARELLEMVKIKLDQANLTNVRENRLVLTGGSANLPGLEDMARRILTSHVRLGVPRDILGLTDRLKNPSYATSVGILLWYAQNPEGRPYHANGNVKNGHMAFYQRLLNWVFKRPKATAPVLASTE
jgi:cell division protein FtsA